MDVAAAFTHPLSNSAAAEALDEVLGWLPTDEFEFGVACPGDPAVIAYW